MLALMLVALVLLALTADYVVLGIRRHVPFERPVRETSGVFVAPGHMLLEFPATNGRSKRRAAISSASPPCSNHQKTKPPCRADRSSFVVILEPGRTSGWARTTRYGRSATCE